MLVHTDEIKETLKKYEELWTKITNFLRSKTDNSDDNDKKYMKIKFDLDDDLPLNKTLEPRDMLRVIISVFHEGSRYYSQVFFD